MNNKDCCPICGTHLRNSKNLSVCTNCYDRCGEYYNFFARAVEQFGENNEREMVVITCPGATIYNESNSMVIMGVKWNKPGDFSQGYTIVGKPVYARDHQSRRLIPREKANNIYRCWACQDLTVRMRTYNNQKMRREYHQNSPMMPRYDPGNSFSPFADLQ